MFMGRVGGGGKLCFLSTWGLPKAYHTHREGSGVNVTLDKTTTRTMSKQTLDCQPVTCSTCPLLFRRDLILLELKQMITTQPAMFLEPLVISPSYMGSQVTFSLDDSPLDRRPDLRGHEGWCESRKTTECNVCFWGDSVGYDP